MAKVISSIIAFCILTYVNCDSTEPFARFEYKVSFKGPYLTQKDSTIPFWEYGGHAIAGDSYIRLTPSMPGKKGFAWSKKLGEFENFRIDTALKFSGKGRFGGDGLAIWYTENKPDYNVDVTDVFGSKNKWNGLGVLFDSYDNDVKHDNPKISGFVSNDHKLEWNHDSDGSGQDIGHCLRDYRNRPFPVRVRIQYLHKQLKVSVNNGLANEDNNDDYEECFSRDNVILPSKGYFGITAATGGVSDDMDVYSFIVHSLTDKGAQSGTGPSDADRLKYEKEYEEYSKKLKEQLDAISKGHKDAVDGKGKEAEEAEREDEAARQFRQIWEEQAHIRNMIGTVNTAVTDSKQEIKTGITSLQSAIQSIRTDLANRPSGSASDSYALKELKDGVSHLTEKIEQLSARQLELSNRVQRSVSQEAGPNSGQQSACATSFAIYAAVLLQTIIMVGIAIAYMRKQDAAKKFY